MRRKNNWKTKLLTPAIITGIVLTLGAGSASARTLSSICSTNNTRSCTPELILRTSKSYINNNGVDSFYDLFVYERTCDSGEFGFEPFTGYIDLSIRQYDPGVPGQSSYNKTLSNAPWSSPIAVNDVYVTGGRIRYTVPSTYGRIAALMKARPSNYSLSWSDELQINRKTTWELKPINNFWPTGTSGQRTYSGDNFLANKTFATEIGNRSPSHFHSIWKILGLGYPSFTADAVMYFVKNKQRYGYIIPGLPDSWLHSSCSGSNPSGCTESVWKSGLGNALFWIDKNASIGNNPAGERWLVANHGEVYSMPSGTWSHENYMQSASPLCSNGDSGHCPTTFSDPYQCGSTDVPDVRNYILAPEYVGKGWGIFMKVTRDNLSGTACAKNDYIWFVDADVMKDYNIGLDNRGRDIVQIRFVEAKEAILNGSSTASGHREDWFLDSNGGVIRIEDRMVGQEQYNGTGWKRRRYPAKKDPDIFHRDILECPHVSLTANSG